MKVLIGGDFVPQNRVSKLFHEREFEPVLGQLRSIVQEADVSIVNLEAPIVESEQCEAIRKVGPHLKTDLSAIDALNYAGVDIVTLANNHIRDYGDWGVNDTIFHLSRNGIAFVGAGLDLKESKSILYRQVDGITLAIVNCCEHEFSIADTAIAGANPINPIEQYHSIKEAKTKADFVIVIAHGGIEHYPYPTPRMKQVYRFFVDAGADAVINHHQHCYSGFEFYNGKPIVYGVGNLCFDRPSICTGIWNTGYLVLLNLSIGREDKRIELKTIPYNQCSNNPTIDFHIDQCSFDGRIADINEVIRSDSSLEAMFKEYVISQMRVSLLKFSPLQNKSYKSLALRGWLPLFLSKRRCADILNQIQCESHQDVRKEALSRVIK